MTFEIQAHRGARSFFPENTLQAFCKAADLGVRVLELDLVVSKDHEIVVSHDPWLSGPLCHDPAGRPLAADEGMSYPIYDMTYADISAFDCGGRHPSFPLQQRISTYKPLLSTVFREVDSYMASRGMKGRMVYNLELKSWPDKDGVFHPEPDRYAALVLRIVEDTARSGQVRLQSFDHRLVRAAWKQNPKLCYGLLIAEREHIDRYLPELGFLPRYLNPHLSLVDRDTAEYLHAKRIGMIPWTVNRPEDMVRMKQLGAEGIITDYPEVALTLASLQD
ncbi:glycerophosphodiester phosphodiesterase family protein [Chlorobium sp. KB01]|uniref:glycerophosphodiester phosphodiesterase family protein n=1 Tax=Chlorobium sp. KB01 TaxID=1917528 RepID=UPI000975B101|nr:glycerophosphodiester phosphodiesterase family protein [Chlorobium sp. KB01]